MFLDFGLVMFCMTLSEFSDDSCPHTEDWFDEWDDVYEVEEPVIRLIRFCDDCGHTEEFVLEPDVDSDFLSVFEEWEEKAMQGDIEDVGLQIDESRTDGIDAYADIVIEREGREMEVVSEVPYYFYY